VAQTITKSVKELVSEANEVVQTLTTSEAALALKSDKYVFVDLRDFRELKREGKIPGSFSCPRGMLEFWIDPKSPYHKEVFNQNKTYVFYCASAWRSALSAKVAQEMGLTPVCHIEGGFTAWKKEIGEVEKVE
jgi:rhodanese-related sulfurtransferase